MPDPDNPEVNAHFHNHVLAIAIRRVRGVGAFCVAGLLVTFALFPLLPKPPNSVAMGTAISEALVVGLAVCGAYGLIGMLYQHLVRPWMKLARDLRHIHTLFREETLRFATAWYDVPALAHDVSRFIEFAHGYYRQHQSLVAEVSRARHSIARFAVQHEVALSTATREIQLQFQSVLAYANHLDEQIAARRLDPDARFDFDDIRESSLNLKLIAGALSQLQETQENLPEPIAMGEVVQRTLLTLSAALDRRAMRLSTQEIDASVLARADGVRLSQVLWMMLLGTIRYAAEESTLQFKTCRSADGRESCLSLTVSELAPMTLSFEERAEYLTRRAHHTSATMFAETIRTHANVQLAELLVERLGGRIELHPLHAYACEIVIALPAA